MAAKRFYGPIALLLVASFPLSGHATTLQEAVKTALRLNPDMQIAIDERWYTQAQLREQQAGYLPTLDLSGGQGRQHSVNPNVVTVPDDSITLTTTEASLSLTENLFKGFGTLNDVKRMRYLLASAAYKTGGTAEDTALDATEQYLEVLRHQEFVALAEHNLVVLKNIAHMIDLRTRAGISKRADYDQAQSRLDLANDDLVAQRGALIDAKTTYQRVVGIHPQALKLPAAPPVGYLPATEAATLSQAIANNPTLRAANANILAARAQHASSKSTNYPSVDLVLDSQRNYNVGGEPGADNTDEAMIRATWNLYKGGADAAKQRQTAYQAQEASDSRNKIAWELRKNVEISWNAWKEAQDRLVYLRGHRDFSLSTFHSYQLQYKIEQRTLLDVLDAQNEYYQASLSYVTGQYTEMFARYRILNTMGGLLGYLKVPPPPEASVDMRKPLTALK